MVIKVVGALSGAWAGHGQPGAAISVRGLRWRRIVSHLALVVLVGAAGACARRDEPGPVPAPKRVTMASTQLHYREPSSSKPLPAAVTTTPPAAVASQPRRGGAHKIGRPYQIAGRWYVPKHEPGYDKRGIASWYGDKFHGRKTANGETYNMMALSAAHPTLPLPSYVRVTNLGNGRTLMVRVNDRGPYARGRIIDLSRAAAAALDFAGRGLAQVRVQYAGPAPINGDDRQERQFLARQPWYRSGGSAVAGTGARPRQEAGTTRIASRRPRPIHRPGAVYVQAGTFRRLYNAQRLRQRLAPLGPVYLEPVAIGLGTGYRVKIGPVAAGSGPDLLARVAALGVAGPLLVNH